MTILSILTIFGCSEEYSPAELARIEEDQKEQELRNQASSEARELAKKSAASAEKVRLEQVRQKQEQARQEQARLAAEALAKSNADIYESVPKMQDMNSNVKLDYNQFSRTWRATTHTGDVNIFEVNCPKKYVLFTSIFEQVHEAGDYQSEYYSYTSPSGNMFTEQGVYKRPSGYMDSRASHVHLLPIERVVDQYNEAEWNQVNSTSLFAYPEIESIFEQRCGSGNPAIEK